jgi:capsular exopolysaccharide synthesis family protein
MNKVVLSEGGEPRWLVVQDIRGGLPADPVEAHAGPELGVAALWRIFVEWRWLILGAITLAIAGAVVVTLLTTPLYRAQATLEINPPSVEVMDGEDERRPERNDAQFLETQYGLLQSRSLAARVAQDLNLASNPSFVPQEGDRPVREKSAIAKLQQGFDVDPVPNSRLIRISYFSDSPVLTAEIVNSFARSFINSNLERRYDASSYARDFLSKQIAKVKADLEKSERAVVAYAQSAGIVETGSVGGGGEEGSPKSGSAPSSLEGSSLVALNDALATAQTKRITAEQRYRQSRSVGETADIESRTSELRQRVGALEAEFQEKRTLLKPMHPDLVALRSRIDSLKSLIGAEAGRAAGSQSNTLLAEYRSAAAEENSLRQRVGQLRGTVQNLRSKGIQYNILLREADTNRSLYDALLQRYKEIGVAGGIGTNAVSVVDEAETPGSPYSPNLPFNLAVGAGLGLLLGLGGALLLEFVNDTIKTPDDVRDKLQIAPLGATPKLSRSKSLASELDDPGSAISEAYFSLLTSLRFSTDRGAPKSLLVTSSRAGEGKSSTALALATSFARLGHSVLLIDGDLRNPFFAGPVERGLSILLTSDGNVREHIQHTKLDNLWLLPTGAIPPNPAELLTSPRLKLIVSEAMEHFDVVLVDGPPVLGLADAPLLGSVCQATLVVVESGRTRTKAALNSISRLKESGSHVIGALVTKFSKGAMTQGYGYEPYKYIADTKNRERMNLLPTHNS